MADNTNKVTIDADYFAKLHRLANESINICKECREEHTAEEFNALKKECDELRAKFAAAERCIEEIESVMSVSVISECAEGEKVNGIIRAYREAKEAK